jgi:N-acetylneuraminate epimerase
MIRLTICFFAALQFFMLPILAQKNKVNSIQWKIAGALPATNGQSKPLGFAGPVAGVHNDVLVVAGGSNFPDSMPWLGGKKKYYDDAYVYSEKNKKLILHKKTFKLSNAIAYAATCSTEQGIVYAGGENSEGISNKVWLLQWNKKASTIVEKKLPDLPVPLTNAAATVNKNIIYVAGGETAAGASDHFYSLDLNNAVAGWKQLPHLPKLVSHAVMVTQSNGQHNCLYLIAGRKKNTASLSDFYSSVYQFDLKTNEWKEKTSLPYSLSAGTGVATGTNHILLFGGDTGETFHKTEELIIAIANEKDEAKKQQLNQQKIKLQATHPGFSKEVLLYDTITDNWKKIGYIPFPSPVTTVAEKWNNNVLIPGGEIRAGVRTPNILIGKISFPIQQEIKPQRH